MDINNTTTGATVAQDTTKTTTRTVYGWTALDSAVIEQLGHDAPQIDGNRVTLTEDAAENLDNVGRCSCGAAGGFGGFIYYNETYQFFRNNRNEIRAALKQMSEDIGDGCAVDTVRGFNCFKGDAVTVDEIGRVLWGEMPEENDDFDPAKISNALAWFALEETANKWNSGDEIENDTEHDERLTLEEIGAGCYAFVDATSSDPVSEYFDGILSACRWADGNGVDYEISEDLLPAYRDAMG